MSARSAMSRLATAGRWRNPIHHCWGDLPVRHRAMVCLWGGLYVLALVWAVPKCSLAGVVPLLVVLAAAGLDRGYPNPIGARVHEAGYGVRMVAMLICPPEALLIGGLGSNSRVVRTGRIWATVDDTARWALAMATASAARIWLVGHAGPLPMLAFVISVIGSMAVYAGADTVTGSLMRAFRFQRPLSTVWPLYWRIHWPTNLTHLPLVAALAALALPIENLWLRMALPAMYLLVMWAPPDPRTERSFGTYWTRPAGLHRLWMSTGANVLDAADTCEHLRTRTAGRGEPWPVTAQTLEALAGDGLAPDAVQALVRAVRHDEHEMSRV